MRLTVALILALVVAVGAGLYAAQKAQQYHRTAESLATQLEAAEARIGRIQQGVLAVEARATTVEREVRGALNEEPAWRDAPVPPAVRSELCKQLKC
jgi:prefoldin subunit 5